MTAQDVNDMDRNGDDMKSRDQDGGIECARVLDLAPTYADGELSGDLVDSVRAHLMDCSPCRLAVQDHSSLGAWFVPSEEVAVPAGFASQVTALAFSGASAGDAQGAPDPQLTLTPRAPRPSAPIQGVGESFHGDRIPEERGQLLSFSVGLTAAAAAAAILLTLFLASRDEPVVESGPIYAEDGLQLNLDALDQQNRALTEAAQGVAAPSEDSK